jgi:hypothetical protein
MESDREKLVEECMLLRSEGKSPEDLVAILHGKSQTIVESIAVLRIALDLPLQDAKELVAKHKVWATEARAGDCLHGELIAALDSEHRGEFEDKIWPSGMKSIYWQCRACRDSILVTNHVGTRHIELFLTKPSVAPCPNGTQPKAEMWEQTLKTEQVALVGSSCPTIRDALEQAMRLAPIV